VKGKTPEWESKLWSYVASGNGTRCPVYDNCQRRQEGAWCADDNLRELCQLFDNDITFRPGDYDFITNSYGWCGDLLGLVEELAQE